MDSLKWQSPRQLSVVLGFKKRVKFRAAEFRNHRNRIMRLYLILSLFLLCGCTGRATTTNYFTLEESKKWVQHTMHPFLSVNTDKQDSTVIILSTRGKQKGVLGRSFENFIEDSVPVNIHIKYQNRNCLSSQLVAYFFNRNAELMNSDTLLLPQTVEWTEIRGEIKTRNCDFFTLTLEAQGISDKAPGFLSIMGLSLSAKGKALPTTKEREVCSIKSSYIHPWEELLYSPLMNKKILALGETVHGTETLDGLAFSLMKERVLHHNSKLLLLELPIEYTMALNRYVKNDKNFDQSYTDIEHRLKGTLFSDSILQFVNWLKEYNATHNNEVSLYGVDFNPIHLDSKVDLCNFLYTLNKECVSTVDSLCNVLLNNDSKANEILYLLDANESLKQRLTEIEYNLLRHCLSNWDIRSTIMRFGMRDNVMAVTTQKVVAPFDSLNSTTTMFLHFGHTAYHGIELSDNAFVKFSDNQSMGHQLKKIFADDYACLALTCSQGKATLGEQNTFKTRTLKDVPKSSIEYQMSKKAKSISFLSIKNLPTSCTYHIRHIGNKYSENQFFRLAPQAWMDGIVLVEEVEACKKENEFAQSPVNGSIKRLEKLYKNLKALN